MDRRFLTPGWIFGHLLVVAAVLVCLRLGWWQWDRSRESDGSLQNLGYALLWPAFGASFIYMWARFLMLEKAKDAADDTADEQLRGADDAEDDDPADERGHWIGYVPDVSDEEDPELAEYNRRLAALAEEDPDRGE